MYVNTVSGNEKKRVLFKFFCLNIMAYKRCSRKSTSKVELAVCRNKHACPPPKNPNTPKLLEEGVCVLFGLGMWLWYSRPPFWMLLWAPRISRFVILSNKWIWLQAFTAATCAVTKPLPTPWKQQKSKKSFCAPSPVQRFIAFDLWETKWAYVHFINLATSEAASVAQLVGRCGCYPFLFQWVSLHPLWDHYSRKGESFFTSSCSSSTVSTSWVLQYS